MRWVPQAILLVLAGFATHLSYAQQSGEQNLQTCLSGKYPALCDYSRLTPNQVREARTAELRENLRVCITGKYPALCNHSTLTPEQAIQVREAERAENLRVCMDGRYPVLCNRSLLTPEQAKDVAGAEAKAVSSQPRKAPTASARKPRVSDCESGHWIEAVEGNGKIIKIEDGSLWEVNDVDTVTTSIWLPVSEVIVCNGKMVNVDDGESVGVTPVEPVAGRGRTPAAVPGYVIEVSANDEIFLINGQVFKAKTYCFGFEKGNRVKFLSGAPFGACATATLLNLGAGKTCKVWCE